MILREYWEIGLPRAIHNFEKNQKKKQKQALLKQNLRTINFFLNFQNI